LGKETLPYKNNGDQIMEYRMVIEEYMGQSVVHTYIRGPLTMADRDCIGAETIQMLGENDITKCIWDVREAILQYSLWGVHQSILDARDDFRPITKNRVAIIYRHNKTEFEHARVAAQNRGIPNINFFQNFEQGIHWLTRQE
jgi:hypothetical protein